MGTCAIPNKLATKQLEPSLKFSCISCKRYRFPKSKKIKAYRKLKRSNIYQTKEYNVAQSTKVERRKAFHSARHFLKDHIQKSNWPEKSKGQGSQNNCETYVHTISSHLFLNKSRNRSLLQSFKYTFQLKACWEFLTRRKQPCHKLRSSSWRKFSPE